MRACSPRRRFPPIKKGTRTASTGALRPSVLRYLFPRRDRSTRRPTGGPPSAGSGDRPLVADDPVPMVATRRVEIRRSSRGHPRAAALLDCGCRPVRRALDAERGAIG